MYIYKHTCRQLILGEYHQLISQRIFAFNSVFENKIKRICFKYFSDLFLMNSSYSNGT